MTKPEDVQAETLRRLALGEIDESDPEAAAVLDDSPAARAEWEELRRTLRALDGAGDEDRDLLDDAPRTATDTDRALAEGWFAPRFARIRHERSRLRMRTAFALVAATAMVAAGVWIGQGRRAEELRPFAMMSAWEADHGLVCDAAVAAPEGAYTLRWSHDTDSPRRPATVYRLVLVDSASGDELTSAELDDPEWTGAPLAGWTAAVGWRVRAFDAEGSEYAAGHGSFRPTH